MNKQVKFIIFMLIGFLSFIGNIFAFDASLQLDKSETDINDYVNLRIQVSSSEGGQIGVKEIKGLENFEKVGQSQSQSSSTSMVMINGKTETKTKTTINLDLTLKAKSKGEFKLGPAILDDGKNEIKTNSVKIKVSGDNLFINQNHLKINSKNNSKQNIQNNLQQNNNFGKNIQNKQEEEKINTYNDIKNKDFSNNKELYLFLGILLITLLGGYFVFKNNPVLLEKLKNNNLKDNIDSKIEDNIIENKEKKEVDFNEIKKEMNYPELVDDDFINKISDILKQKLQSKFKIGNINSKSFEEISKEINDEKILELINLINKAKYSNIILDKNKILKGVKNI